ncbi:nascent polypeptide-associated complex protein [Candidatus Woesearchaeota archaeon]|nr:nascent polypeptide-associated complex protein [Candidatus Woesearchaeota archaeon]
MFPGMNPKDVQKAMKKLGIKQEEIPATEVVIKTPENEIVITSPQVLKVDMMGQETFQISGEIHVRERKAELDISEEDIKTVMEQANCSRKVAEQALQETGDIAAAILKLQEA